MPCNKISHEHRHRDRLVVCHDYFWPEICVPCIHKCDNGCCRIAEVRNIYKASSPRQLQKNPGSLTAPGQSYAWTLCYYIFAVLSLDSATLHLGRGIRPIGLSPNILTRASSHRIFALCLHCSLLSEYYSITEATRPDPTVRPPSRIAKVRPWLIAIGWISSIVISMLSPGMHISVPSGRVITPVTSVVLK